MYISMHIYIYICIYVYIYIGVYVYICIFILVYVHTYIYIYMFLVNRNCTPKQAPKTWNIAFLIRATTSQKQLVNCRIFFVSTKLVFDIKIYLPKGHIVMNKFNCLPSLQPGFFLFTVLSGYYPQSMFDISIYLCICIFNPQVFAIVLWTELCFQIYSVLNVFNTT